MSTRARSALLGRFWRGNGRSAARLPVIVAGAASLGSYQPGLGSSDVIRYLLQGWPGAVLAALLLVLAVWLLRRISRR